MNKCKECLKLHDTDNEYFCPACQEKYEKREEFRVLMSRLEKYNQYPEDHFMSGFSYAEQERFSLIFMKLMRKFHLPLKFGDFANEKAKREAREILRPEIQREEQINTIINNTLYDCGECFRQTPLSIMKKNGDERQNWHDLACPHCGSKKFFIKQLKHY